MFIPSCNLSDGKIWRVINNCIFKINALVIFFNIEICNVFLAMWYYNGVSCVLPKLIDYFIIKICWQLSFLVSSRECGGDGEPRVGWRVPRVLWLQTYHWSSTRTRCQIRYLCWIILHIRTARCRMTKLISLLYCR